MRAGSAIPADFRPSVVARRYGGVLSSLPATGLEEEAMTVYRTDRAVGAAPGDAPLCREDTRLLTGRGEFLDDVAFSGGMIARPKRNSASTSNVVCSVIASR